MQASANIFFSFRNRNRPRRPKYFI